VEAAMKTFMFLGFAAVLPAGDTDTSGPAQSTFYR
jgi:hypothetical protein